MAGRQTIFDAIVANATTELYIFEGLQASAAAGALLLEVLGGASANFTLDIQGKVHEDGTYTNLDYIQLYQAGAAALANSQLTVNDQTVRFYLIPIPTPLIQLVAVFTAGSLTIHASYIHLSFALPGAISSSGAIAIEGDVAHDAVDSGNPIKIGGAADTTDTDAVANGDRVNAHFDQYGSIGVFISQRNNQSRHVILAASGSDGALNTDDSLTVTARAALFEDNAGTWARGRGNTEITVLATASRTSSTNSADLTNYNHKGVLITLDVTTDPGSGETLQLLVQHKDAESSKYEILLDDGANATPGTRSVIIYPGTAGSGNDIVSTAGYPLPRTWRVRVVHSASGSWAYTVGASMIL